MIWDQIRLRFAIRSPNFFATRIRQGAEREEPERRLTWCSHLLEHSTGLSRSFYTSPNAPNVRTLNGHIEIALGDMASAGMLGQ